MVEHWQDEMRADGVEVVPQHDGADVEWPPVKWAIVTPWGKRVETCPCCDLPFNNRRAAQLVADVLYPFRGLRR